MIPTLALLFVPQAASAPTPAPRLDVSSSVWADADGDGRLDLATVRVAGTLQLLLNAGDGRFEDATERVGLAPVTNAALLAWADYDGDGRLDVFVGAREGASRLYRNEGGAFVDMSAGNGLASSGPVQAAYWFDHDGDERPDLFVATALEGVLSARLYRGLEGGFFEAIELPALEGAFEEVWSGTTLDGGENAIPAAPGSANEGEGKSGKKGGVLHDGRMSVAGKPAAGGFPSSPAAPGAGPVTPSIPSVISCLNAIRNQAAAGACIEASTNPTLGKLYPLSTNLSVSPAGRVGMGTTTPDTRLHVFDGSAGAVTANPYSPITAESSTDCYVSILSPAASERGVIFGEPGDDSAGSILYNSFDVADGFDLRTNGGFTRMVISGNGRVGIGTTAPLAKLDILGGADEGGLDDPVALAIQHRLGGFRHFIRSRHNSVQNNPGNAIDFFLNDATSPSASSAPGIGNRQVMTLNGQGKVGIGTTSPQANLTVTGTGNFRGNHIALFENTSAVGGDGIAIQVDQASTNRDNNFITFYNGSAAVTGRIEGFSVANGDWIDPPPMPNLNPQLNVTLRPTNQWWNPGTLPTFAQTGGTSPSFACNSTYTFTDIFFNNHDVCTNWTFNSGTFPTLNFGAGTLPSITGIPVTVGTPPITFIMPALQQMIDLYCWVMQYGIPSSIINLDPVAIGSQLLAIQAAKLCNDAGVTYGSKGADYAEWLEKSDRAEDIRWGQIVGVRAGKISKTTVGAEQLMVVSRAPAVVGNQPQGEVENWERVAFMGQVHVVVRGHVQAGDYIVASGEEDGTGIAVGPDDLGLEHLSRIVGRAWEDSANEMISFVNLVVGVQHEAAAHVLAQHASRLDERARQIDALSAENASLRAEVASVRGEQVRLAGVLERLEVALGRGNAAPVVTASAVVPSDFAVSIAATSSTLGR